MAKRSKVEEGNKWGKTKNLIIPQFEFMASGKLPKKEKFFSAHAAEEFIINNNQNIIIIIIMESQ